MTTTTQLREWWAPPCEGPRQKVALHGEGMVSVRTSIVDAVHALNRCLIAFDYRTRKEDTGAYNCRQITGGTRYSLHAYGTALDLNWTTNPYGPRLVTDMPREMVAAIKAIRTRGGRQVWRWGGDYGGNKDAMHFEVCCHPADLEGGLDPSTIPQEDDMELSTEQIDQIAEAVVMKLTGFPPAGNTAWIDGRLAVVNDKLDAITDRQVPKATATEGLRNVKRIGHAMGIATIEGGNPDEVAQ